MVELVIRLVFSLAVVLGMLLLLTRLSAKKFRGGTNALVRVVHRQQLSRTSSVAVLTVGSRVLVVGTTEHQVQLLTELDPGELEVAYEPVALTEPAPVDKPVASASYDEPVGSADFDVPVGSADFGGAPQLAELSAFSTLDELFEPARERSGAPSEPVEAPYFPRHADRATETRTAEGPLAGSLLSAQTWKQAFAAATGRARDVS